MITNIPDNMMVLNLTILCETETGGSSLDAVSNNNY